MTELYIDGQKVLLNDDFMIDFYRYNPFFSKKGDYTYDIDINLNVPENARIYKHIQRPNRMDHPVDRAAVLIFDQMAIKGTEVILSVENNIVKIQIVAGNSELNYLSAGGRRIQDYDLGSIPELDTTIALQSLSGSYPDWGYVCTPILSEFVPYPLNSSSAYTPAKMFNHISRDVVDGLQFESKPNIRPQAYLLNIIDRLCAAMGYSIIENALHDTIFAKSFIVNAVDTLAYNEMLPNWEVNKFLTEVEKWCNVIFVVDQANKQIRILKLFTFYQNADTFEVPDNKIIDYIEKNYDEDNSFDQLYENVSYNIPSSQHYEYAVLKPDLLSACEERHYASYNELVKLDSASLYNQMTIFVTDDNNQKYILKRAPYNNSYVYYYTLADTISSVIDDESENETDFDIVPAEVVPLNMQGTVNFRGTNRTMFYSSMIPYCRNQVSSAETSEDNGINEYVSNGMPEESVPDKIFVALYAGIQQCLTYVSSNQEYYAQLKYPISIVNPFAVIRHSGADFIEFRYVRAADDIYDLSVPSLHANDYVKNLSVNVKEEHVYKFIKNREMNDTQKIFLIRNRLYFCQYLHYQITANGISQNIEGSFFPL